MFSKASDFVPSASFIVESQKLYKVLYNSGDAEKFYTNFFTIMPLKAEEFFQNINKNAAMLLVLKFADSLIAFEKERGACRSSDKANSPEPSKISDNEKSALQYLGGYVLHNLHKKIRASKKYNSEENQQALSFLRSARTLEDKSQKLVNGLSRGGLWMANDIAQAIFVLAEKLFRTETNVQNIKKIDCSSLVTKALNSIETRAKFNLLLEDCSMEVDKKIGLDTLQQIFALYFRVRSFSFAKDIVEKYKNANHKVKSKALRTEIKRSSDKVLDHADQNA